MTIPPDKQTRYRLLTGEDVEEFGRRVSDALDAGSDALDAGFELYGSPFAIPSKGRTLVAQALLRPDRATVPAKLVPEEAANAIVLPEEVADGITPLNPRP